VTKLLTPTENGTVIARDTPGLREEALLQLKKRRDFHTHLVAYVLVNTFLWLIWAVVLIAADGTQLPWPLFPMAGWGIGLAFHAWDTYGRKPFTDADINRELARLRKAKS
jgi:2TM domain-containing protein